VTLALSVGLSLAAIALVGGTLLAAGAFYPWAVSAPLLALSIAGLPGAWRWARAAFSPWWRSLALVALALPVIVYGAETLHPAHSFQWYYWGVGRELTLAGGIPDWALEFGERVRWHPDYVFFSIGSEVYRWFTGPLTDSEAISAWRAPAAVLGLTLAYGVLRLWVSRLASLIGMAALAAGSFYLIRFNAYKPESLGVVLALAALLLLVSGVRQRRGGLIVAGAATLGLGMGVHGIAVAVVGALAGCAVLVELFSADTPRWPLVRGIAASGLLCVVLIVSTGLALQGRAVVAADAANPALAGEADPTWVFLERHEGNFASLEPPPLSERVEASLEPWPSGALNGSEWAVPLLLLSAGLGLAGWLAGPSASRGAASIALWAVILVGAGAFFAISFDTFIPQQTGVSRIGAYLSLGCALAVGVGAQGLIAWWRRRGRVFSPLVVTAVLVFLVAWALPLGLAALADRRSVEPSGRAALAAVNARAEGGAILSNVSTRGVLEFRTGLEAPVEGRQPVIEDASFLEAANERLSDVEAYFADVGSGGGRASRTGAIERLDVGWVLAARRPVELGSPFSFGGPRRVFRGLRSEPSLEQVWHRRGFALYAVNGAPPSVKRVGEPKHAVPVWGAGLGATLAAFALARASFRRDERGGVGGAATRAA
jgi:hypothetical protein